MGTHVFFDLETYSPRDIADGVYAYAEEAEILLFAYALGDAPARLWEAWRDPIPHELRQAFENKANTFVAHNSNFDRVILKTVMPELTIDARQVEDTMVMGLYLGLPRSLGELGVALGLRDEHKKIALETRTMSLFCKPNSRGGRVMPDEKPDQWASMCEYAVRDVVAMREAWKILRTYAPLLPDSEYKIWAMDQDINDRGIFIDKALCEGGVALQNVLAQDGNTCLAALTDGAVRSVNQTAALLTWLEEQGVNLPDLRAGTVDAALAGDLPTPARDVLLLRQALSNTSVRKYSKLLSCVCTDGRVRGTLQYYGASRTGRWAGRLFQPQNLPRPSRSTEDVDRGTEAIRQGVADLVEDNPLQAAKDSIRGALIADSGRKLVVADLANIEGRVAAWLAGEDWKIKAFEAYDKGQGPDIYKLAYSRAFNVPVEAVGKSERQVGKVMELALGYGGGVHAFTTFATLYGMDLDAMAAGRVAALPENILCRARENLDYAKRTGRVGGMKDDTYVFCETIKLLWRNAHPAISGFWSVCEQAFSASLGNGGVFPMGALCQAHSQGHAVVLRLPSGRALVYWRAGRGKDGLVYHGADPKNGKYARLGTYGGKLFENLCQAVARDVLAVGMARLEDAGYNLVLTVHDEVICEVPDTERYTVGEVTALMTLPPVWGAGLPLAAEGFETKRYGKG